MSNVPLKVRETYRVGFNGAISDERCRVDTMAVHQTYIVND